MNWCWLISHYPMGPVWEHFGVEGSVYIYKCKHCKKLIVFDSKQRKWIEW